jgi:hypothetical protein
MTGCCTVEAFPVEIWSRLLRVENTNYRGLQRIYRSVVANTKTELRWPQPSKP